METQEVVLENKEDGNNSLILENEYVEEKASNGLENFQIEENDTPDLFDSDHTTLSENNENDQEFSSFVQLLLEQWVFMVIQLKEILQSLALF